MATHQTRTSPLNEDFRKSSFSKPGVYYCVEVARKGNDTIVVRDSKNPGGGTLHFSGGEWDAFIKGANAGEFNA